jgi:excisionase family DNA binding protein
MLKIVRKNNLEDLPALFTEKDLREVVFGNRLSKNNTYAMIHSKGFPTVKIGSKYFISKEEFKEWIRRNAVS